MTTIAYRDGHMAADSQITRDNEMLFGTEKLMKLDSGLIGLAGEASAIPAMQAFMAELEQVYGGFIDVIGLYSYWDAAPDFGSVDLLIATQNGALFTATDRTPPVRIYRECAALGTGAAYALGALYYGASAYDAVKAAAAYDPYTGGEIKQLSL